MFDFGFSFWNALAGLSGTTVIGLVALSILAPSIFSVVAEYLRQLAPVAGHAGEGVVYLAKKLKVAAEDILDTPATLGFVVLLGTAMYFYGAKQGSTFDKDAFMSELRKEYRFVPKSETEKRKEQGRWTIF
jgi:cell division protein FtsX